MIKALLSILNVVEGEEKPVLLILGYGFFMGVFLAAYKIVATTLFLNQLSEYIKEAFFVSGILGVLSTWIYSSIQDRVRYSRVIIFNILSILIFIAFARVMFVYSDSKWLIFLLFVMLGPITSLLVLGFWGIFGRLFDLRQSKRIIGGIDSGQLTAIIITTFSIPFIIPYIADIRNILIIGELGLAISIVFFILIVTKHKLASFHEKRKEAREANKFSILFKNKYIVYLSLFLFLSMAAFVIADFMFMNVIEQQYPDEKQLASFLGVFEGSIMVLTLLIQTFINERLLSMYGMKVSLMILPVVLFLFTGLAIFFGYIFGFDITSTEFIWFFLFIALSKLFVTTLREAIENPVFKLFFMPLDSKVRFDIQTKIEGIINEFSRAIGGGLILLLGLLPFFKLIHFSWILVLVIIVWGYILFKAYNLYKVNIRLKLERQREAAEKVEQKGKKLLITKLFTSIDSDNHNLMIFALRALAKIEPEIFDSKIESIKNDHSIDITNKVLQTMEGDFSFIHVAKLNDIEFGGGENSHSESDKYKTVFDKEILDLAKSSDPSERKLAAELIGAIEIEENVSLLIDLLNDTNSGVIKAAMKATSELRKMELLPFVLDNLHKNKYKDVAVEVLVKYGESAFTFIESIFYHSDDYVDTKIDIINIYGKVGGALAQELLWNKVDYPDKKIISQVLLSLSHCGFVAKENQIQRIKLVIEEDVVNIIWNLKAIEQLKALGQREFSAITDSLKEENDHNYGHIYMLLAMIYDQKSIELVKENIETKTNEGISYAIELLDVFLSEDLKQKIIPILDDTSDIDRIRRLEMFYPFIEISLEELLRMLINKDVSVINRWTRTSTIHYIGQKKITGKFDMELIANLFNPDELLKEISAWAMHQIDDKFVDAHLDRLEPGEKNNLKNLLIGQDFDNTSELRPHMKFEIVHFLIEKSLLGGLPSYILSSIADFIDEVYMEGKTMIQPSEWHNDCFYIIYHGLLEVKNKNGEIVDQFETGDFIGEQINIDLLEEEISFEVERDTVLLKIEKNKFLDLITNEYEVTLKLLDSFTIQNEKILINEK